jgi:hypothetical protein
MCGMLQDVYYNDVWYITRCILHWYVVCYKMYVTLICGMLQGVCYIVVWYVTRCILHWCVVCYKMYVTLVCGMLQDVCYIVVWYVTRCMLHWCVVRYKMYVTLMCGMLQEQKELTLSWSGVHICLPLRKSIFKSSGITVSHFLSMLPSALKYLYSFETVRMHFLTKQPCTNDTVCNAAMRLKTLPPAHSYGNQRLQRQFDGLLMMGIVMLETWWAVSVQQGNKFYDCLLHLVVCFIRVIEDARKHKP